MPVFAPRTLRHWARIVPTETLPRSNFPTCRRETYAQTHTQKPSFKGKIKQGNRHWATPCTRPSIVFRGRFEWFGNIVQPWFVCVLRALLFFFPLLVLLLSDGTGKEGWPHNIFLLLIFFYVKNPKKLRRTLQGRAGDRAAGPSVQVSGEIEPEKAGARGGRRTREVPALDDDQGQGLVRQENVKSAKILRESRSEPSQVLARLDFSNSWSS